MAGGRVCGSGAIPRTVAVERLAAGDHACLGFERAEDRWAIRAAFAAIGLARGERVLFFTEPEVNGRQALDRLAAHGLAAAEAAGDGRLEVVNSTPGYAPGQGFDARARMDYWAAVTREALTLGFTGLRATGDMAWAAEPEVDGGELASYENRLTPVFAALGCTGICEYDRRNVPPALLGRVLAAHPLTVLPAPGMLHACREEDTLRLTGDADLATRGEFELCLRESVRAPGLDVIDLTGLAFLDVSCARTLLRLAAGTTLQCTAAQYRLLRLCGAGETDGVGLLLR